MADPKPFHPKRGLYFLAVVFGLMFALSPFMGHTTLPSVPSNRELTSSCMDEFAQQVRTEMYGRAGSQAFCDSMQRLRSAPR